MSIKINSSNYYFTLVGHAIPVNRLCCYCCIQTCALQKHQQTNLVVSILLMCQKAPIIIPCFIKQNRWIFFPPIISHSHPFPAHVSMYGYVCWAWIHLDYLLHITFLENKFPIKNSDKPLSSNSVKNNLSSFNILQVNEKKPSLYFGFSSLLLDLPRYLIE